MRIKAAAQRRFDEHRKYLAENEPGLALSVDLEEGLASIAGTLAVPIGAGIVRSYQIEITYAGMSPYRLPTTRETAGDIARDVERHIMSDGGFCMWLPQTAPRDFDSLHGLALHLDRVREFLLLQVVYEDNVKRGRHPAWPGPAWSHGGAGHREWVREQTVGLSHGAIAGLYAAAASAKPIQAGWCPCGSARPTRVCHADWIRMMRGALPMSPSITDELLNLWKERRGQTAS